MTTRSPSPSLVAAVAAIHDAFSGYAKPTFALDLCTACCVSEQVNEELSRWPLDRLTARHFHEYNSSAKSEEQHPGEVGHFLPRMLELLAAGQEIHHSSENSLDRLGRCPPGSWNDEQRAALSAYALAYFDQTLRDGPLHPSDDPLSVMLMFDIGGIQVEPLLDHWLRCEHPHSTVQFVRATYWDFWEHRDYRHAFAHDRQAFREKLRAWLLAPDHQAVFADRMMAPDFLTLAEDQDPVGHTSFSTMVGGVFDNLLR